MKSSGTFSKQWINGLTAFQPCGDCTDDFLKPWKLVSEGGFEKRFEALTDIEQRISIRQIGFPGLEHQLSKS